MKRDVTHGEVHTEACPVLGAPSRTNRVAEREAKRGETSNAALLIKYEDEEDVAVMKSGACGIISRNRSSAESTASLNRVHRVSSLLCCYFRQLTHSKNL